jgi:DnaJ-class molecular chaperone
VKPSDAVKEGLCPSCLGKGVVTVLGWRWEKDDIAECVTCAGTGLFPLRCTRCDGELHMNIMSDWVHVDPDQHNHVPRLPPKAEPLS